MVEAAIRFLDNNNITADTTVVDPKKALEGTMDALKGLAEKFAEEDEIAA